MGLVIEEFTPKGSHTSAGSLDSATEISLDGANWILMEAVSNDIRYTLDGTTPTSSKGFLLETTGDPVLIKIEPSMTLTVIETAASATLEYQLGE